jgi:predicted AlkP superfamily phosphohydrolase/phosphomutase
MNMQEVHEKGKLLIIGLDAGTLDLVRPWAEQGFLPHLARLMREGASGTLQSTVPTISPAAWMSMITGKNPGKHGVFDFIRRVPESYRLEYVQPSLSRIGTLFGRLSQAGRRVGVLGVPVTYPPEPVNGFMISGPWAPENERCVFPSEMFPYLMDKGYSINNKVSYTPETAGSFLKYIEDVTDVRASVTLDLLQREPWDLFMAVFRDTDTVASFYWHDMDPTHPQHDPQRAEKFSTAILDHYRQLDSYIGKMMAVIDENTTVMVVSDHGSGALYSEISLNRWLADTGFLTLKSDEDAHTWYQQAARKLGITRARLIERLGWPMVHRLKRLLPYWLEQLVPWSHPQLFELVDWSKTQAYSFGSIGQIYVNLQGREPGGIVEPDRKQAVIEEIVDHLDTLQDPRTGRKIEVEIFYKEGLYNGPYTEQGPDLNLIFDDLSCITHITLDAVRADLITESADYETGFHRRNGMWLLWGKHIRPGIDDLSADIVDVAPLVYYLLDEPLPDDLDGVVHLEVLEPDFVDERPIRTKRFGDCSLEGKGPDWTDKDEEKITDYLRKLGYLK